MEDKVNSPSFTVSLRGYDREEVDEYLDSLAEALAQVEQAEEHSRRLQAHVARCNGRIKELEDRIRSDTPKTGAALGERVGVLLQHAEEAATEIVGKAESDASRIVTSAEARAAEADEHIRHSTALAEEQARRIESVARGEAAEIVSEAEGRAAARTRQIEQWAEQVVSHTRAEEARMVAEQERARRVAEAELAALEDQRSHASGVLDELRESLGQALGLIDEPVVAATAPASAPTQSSQPEADDDPAPEPEVSEAPAAPLAVPTVTAGVFDGADDPITASIPVVASFDDDEDERTIPPAGDAQFEAKLDRWVSGGR
jgi:DivIVA domain-containing protein